MKKTNNTNEVNAKGIAKGVYVRDIILAAFVALTVGLIGGYFASINVTSGARQSVVQDMTLVQDTAKKVSK